MHAHGSWDEVVIEKVRQLPGAILPTRPLHLAGGSPAVGVLIGFCDVVVITRFGGPVGVDVRVERPIG